MTNRKYKKGSDDILQNNYYDQTLLNKWVDFFVITTVFILAFIAICAEDIINYIIA